MMQPKTRTLHLDYAYANVLQCPHDVKRNTNPLNPFQRKDVSAESLMKPRTAQLGVLENPASLLRQHGSHLAVNSVRSGEDNLEKEEKHGATGEDFGDSALLTVQDVAARLRAPASWIYARMRKCSQNRLPAYRLGKYWRFKEAEILTWLEAQNGRREPA